ncbi:hypothetical protein Moror_8867 [Moniliophthora roreri MCA 2997]|uniref:Uncharacterized protein n=2 Tax=Moniliophthora roreri TaxID=221103 RepID=V2XH92_MONRO|nr:hypothetical protein Moror_8867 [Moniliophthora roreri MCA 2997]KAI3604673.1 hypothetical protein WG66_008442 [Moniliophthora roreri]
MNCSRCGLAPQSPRHIPKPSSATITLSETNISPIDSDRGALESSLSVVQSHIDDVANDISRLEGILNDLRQEHQRLCDVANVYQAVLHPIRIISDEILVQIFRNCAEEAGMMELYPRYGQPSFNCDSLNTRKPPWTLSQVSRRWRSVALSDSSLWSYLGVMFPDPRRPAQKQANMVSRLMLQIQRSRQFPLAVSFHSSYPVERFNPLLVTVCSHSTRWENLRVKFRANGLESLQCLSSLIKGNIPALRRLHLQTGSSIATIPSDNGLVIDGFQYAPNLQDLAIWGHTGRLADVLQIPWSQITRYRTFDRGLIAERSLCYAALSKMPNLETFHENRTLADNLVHTPPVNLSSLHTLSFGIAGENPYYHSLSALLERLTLSNLRDLRIDATTEIEHLPQFLSHSAATLRVLKLRIKDSAAVVPLLERVSGVEHLALRGSSPEAVSALAEREGTSGRLRLLPRLQRLALWTLRSTDVLDENLILAVAQSRVGTDPSTPTPGVGDYCLRYLEIDDKFTLGSHTLESLQALKPRGLRVQQSSCGWFFLSAEEQWK